MTSKVRGDASHVHGSHRAVARMPAKGFFVNDWTRDECGHKMDDREYKLGQKRQQFCRENFVAKLDFLSLKSGLQ